MGKASPAYTSWNAGELSPYMEGRVDQARYQNGAHTLQNFQALVQGPAMRRGGHRFVEPVKNSAQRTFVRPFVFSITQAFVLEFGDKYIRFYTNHGQVQVSGVPAFDIFQHYNVGDLASSGGVNYYSLANQRGIGPPGVSWYALTGTIYEVPAPWASADLVDAEGAFSLKIEQSGDVLYIAGGAAGAGYAPQTLTRFGDTDWVLTPFFPTDGPFANANPDRTSAVWASGINGTVSVNSSQNLFAATDIGRLMRIAVQSQNTKPWVGNAAYTAGNLVNNGFNVYKALNSATSGPDGPVHISGTAFDGLTGVQWLYMDSGYGIVQFTGFSSATQMTANVLTQLPQGVVGTTAPITAITQANPAVVTATQTFTAGDNAFITGVTGMTQINNTVVVPTIATGTTLTLGGVNSTSYSAYSGPSGTIIDGATTEWALGAWSNTSEWPRVVKFFRSRLWWLGALSVNGSVPGLYTSYAVDTAGETTDNNAISITLSFDDVTTICWASPLDRLLIGSDGGEFALYEQTTQTPLGPDNVQIVRQSKKRCRSIDPVTVNTSILYVQRAARKLMAMDYDFTIDKYKSTDQSVWAYHMSEGGFTDMCYQAEPWSTVWLTRPDGTLIGFTFDREQEVYAWHRHVPGPTIGGSAFVESVCSVPEPDGSRDELWCTTKRIINGQVVRFVEFQEKIYEDGDAQSSCFYVDAGATYNGAPTVTISGLSYLQGETVNVLADGASHPNCVVSATGTITLNILASVVQVGLPCPAVLVTERPEAGADTGTSQGKTKRAQWATIRLYNTLGGFVAMDGSPLDELQYRFPVMPMGSPPPLFTGDIQIGPFSSDYNSDQRFHIEQRQPFPMTVIGFFPSLTGYEPN